MCRKSIQENRVTLAVHRPRTLGKSGQFSRCFHATGSCSSAAFLSSLNLFFNLLRFLSGWCFLSFTFKIWLVRAGSSFIYIIQQRYLFFCANTPFFLKIQIILELDFLTHTLSTMFHMLFVIKFINQPNQRHHVQRSKYIATRRRTKKLEKLGKRGFRQTKSKIRSFNRIHAS